MYIAQKTFGEKVDSFFNNTDSHLYSAPICIDLSILFKK